MSLCGECLLTSMHNVLVVQVVDCFEYLLDRLGGILLCELSLVANPVEELAAGGKLGDDIVLVLKTVSDSFS
jgi:hypothetical protein